MVFEAVLRIDGVEKAFHSGADGPYAPSSNQHWQATFSAENAHSIMLLV
jgi:hypothetical protein